MSSHQLTQHKHKPYTHRLLKGHTPQTENLVRVEYQLGREETWKLTNRRGLNAQVRAPSRCFEVPLYGSQVLPHGVCLPCFSAMNRFYVAAAPKNFHTLVVAVMIPAVALFLLSPVQTMAFGVVSENRSPYAALGVDELSQYLRYQRKQVQRDVDLEESVIQGSSSDHAAQVRLLSTPLPWGAWASVSARLEPVDLDRLRALTADTSEQAREQETRVGVDGSVYLGNVGALRIGYEVTQWQDRDTPKVATVADADLEYNLSERALLAAGYNLDRDPSGTTATANVGVGYALTKSAMLRAGYQLVNFSDAGSREYKANVTRANLTLRF